MNKNQIEAFVARWLNAVKTGNVAEFEHLVAEDAVDLNTGQATSRAAFRERAATVQRAFAELAGQVDELLIDGDRIAWRWTLTGIQRAPFLGEPGSGKRVRLSGVNFQRLQGGVVIEHYTLFDGLGALRQLR
jgi:steroid delta-isomerase-like uncharacterized protein